MMRLVLAVVVALISCQPVWTAGDSSREMQHLLPGCQSLKLSTWQDQLALSSSHVNSHWVYLSANNSCEDRSACESFDRALSQEHHRRQHSSAAPTSSLSFIDCDAEPVLCHSWLLKSPALMHIAVHRDLDQPSPRQLDTAAQILMRPIALPLPPSSPSLPENCSTNHQQVAFLMKDQGEIESFSVWDGLLNPFTGRLGKHGGGIVWGQIKRRIGWLPVPQQTFAIGVLLLLRLLVYMYTPKTPATSIEEMILRPGSLDGRTHENTGGPGDVSGQGESAEAEDRKNQ
jgi:hypothetical protein